MKIYICTVISVLIALASSAGRSQQLPPLLGRELPNPGHQRIEVRFALGVNAVECKRFHLTATHDGKIVIDGSFESGFTIPTKARHLPHVNKLDLVFSCGDNNWHFTQVGERAFLQGWWWVGTDFPPFQETFKSDQFKDAAWIRYLIVKPTLSSGFNVYHYCPKGQEEQASGPCAPD
jgi:hypothetical protein